MQYKHEIKDTFWLIGLQGLNYLAPLLVWPYLMNVLGAEGFGRIGFAQSVCLYLMLVVDFGYNFTATKRIALCRDDRLQVSRVFAETMLAKLFLLVLCFVFAFALVSIPVYRVYRSAVMMLFLQVVGQTFTVVWLFQGMGRIRMAGIINCICKVCILPLCFLFVHQPDDYLIAAFIQAAVYLCSACVLNGFIIQQQWITRVTVSLRSALHSLKDSFPVFVSNAASGIYSTAFVVILGWFVCTEDVGRYAATEKLMRAILSVSLIPLMQAFFPKVVQVAQSDWQHSIILVRRLAAYTSLAMLAIGAVFYFCSSLITQLLGNDYSACVSLFRAIAPMPFFVGISAVYGQAGLLAIGGQREKNAFLLVYLLAAVVAISGVCLVAPRYGNLGAIWALLLTEMVAAIGMVIAYKKSIIRLQSCG